ncbi:glycosyltransferase family 39 protein [Flaviaesturariibacter terrae]
MASTPNYRRRLVLLLLATSLLRLLLAASFGLGNDEVYYWTYAQHLQWNYFDHPPLVALWIRLFTANGLLEFNELFVRLGSIVSCVIASALLFHTVRRLYSERAGWIAAVLYQASIYAGIIAGLFILPDSPQMLFWCAALWFGVRIHDNPRRWGPWIGFGIMAGLSILGKVHGVFLWFGTGLYILFRQRAWLRRPQLYVAALLTAALASPIFFWNKRNDFITWRFHSERVELKQWAFNGPGLLRELGGQLLYNNPVIVVLLAIALVALARRRWTLPPAARLLAWIGLPMIAVLVAISLLRDTLPHWSGPGYVTLLPLAAIWLAGKPLAISRRWLRGAGAFVLLLVAAASALTFAYPGTMGSQDRGYYGWGDFTLDLSGWREAGPAFAQLYYREKGSTMPYGAPVVVHKWFPGAHEDYYFAAPNEIPVLALGDLYDLHHYAWLNRWRLHDIDPTKAWCIVPSNDPFDPRAQFAAWYTRADSVTTIVQERGGKPARYFSVWKLSGWKKGAVIPVQRN